MAINEQQLSEIKELSSIASQTKRATVPELEEILYEPIKVLDHGFVRVIDYFGNDSAITQAARVSYGKGTKKISEDRGLIHYLMRHHHTTPFEMCEIKFHIKLPIFIARQWIRHRTANVNEYSARYSILGNDYYVPSREHLAAQSLANRQGRDETLEENEANQVLHTLHDDAKKSYEHYLDMMNIDENGNIINQHKQGLARELARMNLPLNYYTEWYWKIDLHNLLHFLMLRADSHAQYEIRAYAEVILDIVKKWVPFSFEAFEEYRMKAVHLSGNAAETLKKMLAGEDVSCETSGMTKREWSEFIAEFGSFIKVKSEA